MKKKIWGQPIEKEEPSSEKQIIDDARLYCSQCGEFLV
jgi:hypothetical protein